MRIPLTVLAIAALVFAATQACAQTARSDEILAKYKACTAHGTGHLLGDYTVPQRIDVCTAGIESHDYDGQDLAAFYFNRSVLRNELKQYADALSDVDAALKVWPDIAHTLIVISESYNRHGLFDVALATLNKAQPVLPNVPTLYFNRATAHLYRHELEAARNDIETAVSLQPDGPNTRLLEAQIDGAQGDYVAAIAAADAAVALSENSALAYNLRCYLRALAGTDLADKALPDCDKALELAPNSPDVMDSRAYVYLRLGRYKDAIAQYNAEMMATPFPPPPAIYGRGLAERKSGKKSRGDDDIATAKSRRPGIEKIFGTRAMLYFPAM